METVFHDIPHMAGFKSFDKRRLTGLTHSTVRIEQALRLADLTSIPLRKLGVNRKQLIDTEADQYPVTRLWAEAIHAQCPHAQGLAWVSRQDDSARAVMLFGDRIRHGVLRQRGISRSLIQDMAAYDTVLNLAERIGVTIIPGLS